MPENLRQERNHKGKDMEAGIKYFKSEAAGVVEQGAQELAKP